MDGTLTIPKHDFSIIRSRLQLPLGKDILKEIARLPANTQQSARKELYRWEEEIAYQGEAAPDALALLHELVERGCKLAVLTRNTKKLAHITLSQAGIDQYFLEPYVLGRSCAKPNSK